MNNTTEIPITIFPTLWPSTTTTATTTSSPSTIQDKPERKYCNQYILKNKTHIIYSGYEGIPDNLLINVCGWITLLFLFTILRKKAWNYGRLALVQKYESRWTQLFYGIEDEMGHVAGETISVSSSKFNIHIDKGMFSWIPALFKIKEEQILAKSGHDAIQYLSFQKHLIVYMMIVTFISIIIVLPINIQGTLQGGENYFGQTTLANLDPKSSWIWVHVSLAFLFLPVGIVFTRRFSKNLKVGEHTSSVSRTLMIMHVSQRFCHKDTLLRHFQEAYPELDVQDVQFAYNIKSLIKYEEQRNIARNARIYCDSYAMETGKCLEMRPYKCGVICKCCDTFGCPKVDAIKFYHEEENRLNVKVENEKCKALQQPTGVAFITFDTIENAEKVMRDHQNHCVCPHSSSGYSDLMQHNWVITVAPKPDNIYWHNLSVTPSHWYVRALIINTVLFITLFFLTTPAIIINTLDIDKVIKNELYTMSPLLSEFIPTLLMCICASIMPVIVSYSDQFMSHWTRSAENHSVMIKTFVFLLFMVIILPSLGLTSAKALFEWMSDNVQTQNSTGNIRWECVFLPDNGAFFVNYIITSTFIGIPLELIRFSELFMYIIRLGLARSQAETASIQHVILYEFEFGVQYSRTLLAFTMTMFYSMSCPLITPFGTLNMIFKHLVDKYNIYFAYGPSKISKNIHISAVNYVIAAIVMLQLSLLFFSIVRNGMEKHITIYSLVLLLITVLVLMTHVLFHWMKMFNPVEYKETENLNDEVDGREFGSISNEVMIADEVASQFVPTVLRDALTGVDHSYENGNQNQKYGTKHQKYGTQLHDREKPKTPCLDTNCIYDDYNISNVTAVCFEINAPQDAVNNVKD